MKPGPFFFTALFIFVTCALTVFLRVRDRYGTLTIKKTKLVPPFTLNDEATATLPLRAYVTPPSFPTWSR